MSHIPLESIFLSFVMMKFRFVNTDTYVCVFVYSSPFHICEKFSYSHSESFLRQLPTFSENFTFLLFHFYNFYVFGISVVSSAYSDGTVRTTYVW